MGTNHLSVGYESSQLWVRIVWVRNVRGYETSVHIPRFTVGLCSPLIRDKRCGFFSRCIINFTVGNANGRVKNSINNFCATNFKMAANS